MAPPYFVGSTNGQEAAAPKTYYEQQREMLVTEIAQVRPMLRPAHRHCGPPMSLQQSSACMLTMIAEPRSRLAKYQQTQPLARRSHVGRQRIRAR